MNTKSSYIPTSFGGENTGKVNKALSTLSGQCVVEGAFLEGAVVRRSIHRRQSGIGYALLSFCSSTDCRTRAEVQGSELSFQPINQSELRSVCHRAPSSYKCTDGWLRMFHSVASLTDQPILTFK
jgi:hypothetical protein